MADHLVIKRKYVERMLDLFTDIERSLDENVAITPDLNTVATGGCNDLVDGEEASIHQRVTFVVSGLAVQVLDETDWFETPNTFNCL